MEQTTKEAPAATMEHERPKSKKELRAEKKALRKQKATTTKEVNLSKEEKRALIKKQKKMEQKEFKKIQRLQILKEERELKKIRKQKRKNIEANTKGGATVEKKTKKKRKQTEDVDQKDRDSAMNVFNGLFNGTKDEITGTTTLAYGVKYKDVIVGKGEQEADDRSLVTVSYKLKGYKGTGAIIDSSKNFTFRVGKGEGEFVQFMKLKTYLFFRQSTNMLAFVS